MTYPVHEEPGAETAVSQVCHMRNLAPLLLAVSVSCPLVVRQPWHLTLARISLAEPPQCQSQAVVVYEEAQDLGVNLSLTGAKGAEQEEVAEGIGEHIDHQLPERQNDCEGAWILIDV